MWANTVEQKAAGECKETPLITIVLTSFNAANFIERAIASAFAQDWPNTEVVIIDDASTDGSVEVIRRCIAGCSNARLIVHSENHGAAAARNTALKELKGDYVAFFDGDDESLPNRLRCQYERLVSYEKDELANLTVCFASGERRYPNGYVKVLNAIGSQSCAPKGEQLAEYLLFHKKVRGVDYGAGTPTCSMFARRSVLLSCSGFDERFRRVEDLDLAIRLSIMGAHFIGCRERLFIQYATEGSYKSAESNLRAELQLVKKYENWLSKRDWYEYAARWPYLRYYHYTGQRQKMLWALTALLIRYPISTMTHFLATGPKRLMHERRMKRRLL